MKKVSVTMSLGSRLTAVWIACQLVGGLAQQPFPFVPAPHDQGPARPAQLGWSLLRG